MSHTNETRTPPKCELGVRGHCISFVQDDELQPFAEQLLGSRKGLDLLPDYVNATVVGCVQLRARKSTNDREPQQQRARWCEYARTANTICLASWPKIRRAHARIVEVFPVPGGP